jgi:hypothetical protein
MLLHLGESGARSGIEGDGLITSRYAAVIDPGGPKGGWYPGGQVKLCYMLACAKQGEISG